MRPGRRASWSGQRNTASLGEGVDQLPRVPFGWRFTSISTVGWSAGIVGVEVKVIVEVMGGLKVRPVLTASQPEKKAVNRAAVAAEVVQEGLIEDWAEGVEGVVHGGKQWQRGS